MAKLSALPLITSLTGLFMVPAVNMTGTKVTERISAADFRTSLFAASASFNATDVLNLGATPPTDGAINVDGTGFTYGIRVSNGNITAPTFVGALTGNADTATLASTASLATNATRAAHATALATPRLIQNIKTH